MNVQLVVFDLAGTTVKENFDVQRILVEAFSRQGLSVSIEQANKVMGIPKPVAIRQLLETLKYPSINEGFIREIHADFVAEMISFYQHDSAVVENDGVTETLQALQKKGIKVVVDTGFDRPIVDALLSRMGWEERGLIAGSVTSDEVANGRPHPDLIFKAMELAGISDVTCVAKVGDTLSDLQEGYAAGCGLIVGIASGAYTKEQLAQGPQTHIIEKIPELIGIFNLA